MARKVEILPTIVSCPGCDKHLHQVVGPHSRSAHGLVNGAFRQAFKVPPDQPLHSSQFSQSRRDIAIRSSHLEQLNRNRQTMAGKKQQLAELLAIEGLITSVDAAAKAGLHRRTLLLAWENHRIPGERIEPALLTNGEFYRFAGPTPVIFSIDAVEEYIAGMPRGTQRLRAMESWRKHFPPMVEKTKSSPH